eukprot:5784881-Pyramimonas_sp.AAC.1
MCIRDSPRPVGGAPQLQPLYVQDQTQRLHQLADLRRAQREALQPRDLLDLLQTARGPRGPRSDRGR